MDFYKIIKLISLVIVILSTISLVISYIKLKTFLKLLEEEHNNMTREAMEAIDDDLLQILDNQIEDEKIQ